MDVDPNTLRILHYPAPSLRKKAEPVPAVDENVRAVVHRMIQLMHEGDGVGLAAPQVGLPWRMFVTNGREADPVDRVFINPRLKLGDGPITPLEEGCLSLPGINVEVRRAPSVVVTAQDLDGNEFVLEAEDLLARICQHEYDHLEATLIIDRMSPMDRLATRKTIKELKAAAHKG